MNTSKIKHLETGAFLIHFCSAESGFFAVGLRCFCGGFLLRFCSDFAPSKIPRKRRFFKGFTGFGINANSTQTQRKKCRIKIESKVNQESPKFPLILMEYKKPADAETSADRCHGGSGGDK